MPPQKSTKFSVPCTFEGCRRLFESENDLIHHKIAEPNHEYCVKCRLDFVDDDAFLEHKIASPNHITCQFCYEDFRTEGGRKIHLEQMHREEQKVLCSGCGLVFARPGGLIQHLESDGCHVISGEEFKGNILFKETFEKHLKAQDLESERGSALGCLDSGIALTDSRVPLNVRPADMLAVVTHKPWERGSMSDDLPSYLQDRNTWPKADEPELIGIGDLPVTDAAELQSLRSRKMLPVVPQNTALSQLTGAQVEKECNSKIERQENEKEKEIEVFRQKVRELVTDKMTGKLDWERLRHPITKKYCCPYYKCRAKCNSLKGLNQHIDSFAHGMKGVQCPNCLARFRSTAALVQHCDSPSTSCRIREADSYNVALDKITAGYVRTDGKMNDGTIKYASGKPTFQGFRENLSLASDAASENLGNERGFSA